MSSLRIVFSSMISLAFTFWTEWDCVQRGPESNKIVRDYIFDCYVLHLKLKRNLGWAQGF